MANFCTKCGSPLTGPFCVKCGTDMRQSAAPAQPQPVQQNVVAAAPEAVPPIASTPAPQSTPLPFVPAAKQGMSPLAKIGITAVVIIFVGGAAAAAGLYYVAHRVSQKFTRPRIESLDQVRIPATKIRVLRALVPKVGAWATFAAC